MNKPAATDHDCKYENTIKTMAKDIRDIHGALLGDLEGGNAGLIHRVAILEAFKGRVLKIAATIGVSGLGGLVTWLILR